MNSALEPPVDWLKELAPPGGGDTSKEKEEPAAQPEEAVEKLGTGGSGICFSEEQAATKIQATYRGYKSRKEVKGSREELEEGEKARKEVEKEDGIEEEKSKPDEKEPQ